MGQKSEHKGFVYASLTGGVFAFLSAFMHGLVGWPSMQLELDKLTPPPDLAGGLMIGWIWGSFTMAGLGIVTISQCLGALKGTAVHKPTIAVITGTYLVFGFWAMFVNGFNPHFLLFSITGLLIGLLLKWPNP